MFFHGILWDLPSGKRLQKTMKDRHFSWGNSQTFDWAMFNSYIKLPEGRWMKLNDNSCMPSRKGFHDNSFETTPWQ